MVKVQELGIKILHWDVLDVLGLVRDIIDVFKEEPVERLLFFLFFLVDLELGVIRKVAVESSNLRGQLEEG